MAAKFVILDRDTPMMLPPDLRDWISEDSMVHFIVDAVEALEIKGFGINERGSGSAQYPPQMMLSLLIYCYATKRFFVARDRACDLHGYSGALYLRRGSAS